MPDKWRREREFFPITNTARTEEGAARSSATAESSRRTGEKAPLRPQSRPGSPFTTRRASASPSFWLPRGNPFHNDSPRTKRALAIPRWAAFITETRERPQTALDTFEALPLRTDAGRFLPRIPST
jgi:hypothetical protein